MMLLIPILQLIVPELVKAAEAKFGSGQGVQKRQWVIDAVNSVLKALNPLLPSWVVAIEGPIVDLIDWAIDSALDKLGV